MKRPSKEEVEHEIAALDTLDTKALRARWQALYRKDPPPTFRARLLRLGIAYRLQELVFGGLQPRTVRLLRKLAELHAEREQKRLAGGAPDASPTRAPASRPRLSTGSQLMREWNGSTEIVDVTDEGFRWRGRDYRTLTAVAVAITGTKWSGPKFFGLVPSSKRRSSARSGADGATRAASMEAVTADGGST